MISALDYEEQLHVISLLDLARKYVAQVHDEAESKHDSYGEYYMDGGMYEIMRETEELMRQIDEVLNK